VSKFGHGERFAMAGVTISDLEGFDLFQACGKGFFIFYNIGYGGFFPVVDGISRKEVFPVLGATPGIIGSIQANEAIKFLTGKGKLLEGRLLLWDWLSGNFSEITLSKLNNCPICGSLNEINENR